MSLLWEHCNVLTGFLLFVGALFLSVYVYFKYCYTYWARRGVPYLTPTFPLGNNEVIGTEAFSYGRESQIWYNKLKQMNVRYGGAWNFHNKVLVLVDTELIRDILTKDFNFFIDRDFFHNPTFDPKTNNLFVSEGEEWRYMRQKMSPAFTSAKMKYMFQCVLESSEKLVGLFENAIATGDDLPIRLLIDKYTMDNIGVVAFGLEFNCQITDNTKFREITDLSVFPDTANKIKWLMARLVPKVARKLGISIIDKRLTDFFGSMVEMNVKQRRRDGTKKNDFTQLLLEIEEISRKNNTRFTMDDIIANCIIFFLAGFDTSSKTMQFTLVELARNQELQDKVRNEINRVLGQYDGKLTYESIQEMTYLRQVIDETLRKYPPVLTLTRICQSDYKLKDSETIIEKGTTVAISVIGLHRDPDLFPDPEKYDPDRFSPQNKANIVPYSYLPFGEGPRNCIGRRFGSTQATVGLVQILKNFKIESSPKTKFPIRYKSDQFLFETDEQYVRATRIQ